MREIISAHPLYYYVSTKAECDPIKTIYVCAPESAAADLESVEQFAMDSGWQAATEENAAILVLPVAPNGWSAEPTSLFQYLFNETRNHFLSRSGKSIPGLCGHLMCWEPIIFGAGYDEGAVFLGKAVVDCPNTFAGIALVNGAPKDFSGGEQPSNHWFVPGVSEEYHVLNRDIPVHVWLFTDEADKAQKAVEYFAKQNHAAAPRTVETRGFSGTVRQSESAPADQVRLYAGVFAAEPVLTGLIMEECFNHVIRWKDGPDGKLALVDSRAEFYSDPRFVRRVAVTSQGEYDYFVHLPDGMTMEEAKGLPLVFTVHGRGEPAWMFTFKNGWDTLADETREFVLASPDSDSNVWFLDRDGEAFVKMVEDMIAVYGVDPSRIYLTGFSNGGMMVREVAIRYPALFAGVSPWNAPFADTTSMHNSGNTVLLRDFGPEINAVIDRFLTEGWQMPCAAIWRTGAARTPIWRCRTPGPEGRPVCGRWRTEGCTRRRSWRGPGCTWT